MVLGACGSASEYTRSTSATSPVAQPSGPAFGLTEGNANLLLSPDVASAGAETFLPARRELTALHPRYLRLVIDWAALQPEPDRPVMLDSSVNGCARGVAPCGAYTSVAGELEAIASQQRRRPGSFQVVIDILGAPSWAAAAPHGCERSDSSPVARPLRPQAIASYQSLIHALLALGVSKGVALPWWSPWNEPNDPRFITPQRATCAADGVPLAPLIYTQLARAMGSVLASAPGDQRLLLGELGGYESASPHRIGLTEFVDALPTDVLCLGDTWAVHAYAGRGSHAGTVDPVKVLEAALDARGGCASSAHLWVTEAGAGAPEPGRPRTPGGVEEEAECVAIATQVLSWYADPRVQAIFQYTFRDDPLFPVGLISADLSRLDRVYRMWLALERAKAVGGVQPTAQAACA